jgi:maltose/moltooligosaccharide transporter
VTFLSAFGLVWLVKKFSARNVHMTCLLLAAVCLFIVSQVENKFILFSPMIGFCIAWASMIGVPYLIVVNQIPKEQYGVYMGIINMMIVVPMILQTLSFGFVFNQLLAGDPTRAIIFAGVLLLIASYFTSRITSKET